MGETVTDDEVDEMILMADVDGAQRTRPRVLCSLRCGAAAGDGQVSFEEFAKLMLSLSAPQAPQRLGAQPLPSDFAGGTGLLGVERGMAPPPAQYAAGGGVPMGAYQGGLPLPPTGMLSASGNPVQVRAPVPYGSPACCSLTRARGGHRTWRRSSA